MWTLERQLLIEFSAADNRSRFASHYERVIFTVLHRSPLWTRESPHHTSQTPGVSGRGKFSNPRYIRRR